MSSAVSLPVCALCWSVSSGEDLYMTRALKLMSETPLIDGHNDLPWQLREQFNNQLNKVDLNTLETTHTNIPKIKTCRLGAQSILFPSFFPFWSAYVPCESQYKDAVRKTLEQIEVIHRMCQKYPKTFTFATSSQGQGTAFGHNETASLIGVEGGGHSIDSSLGTLRTLYHLGVRYLTLTHSCNTPWADNWLADTGSELPQHNGLSPSGKQLIVEMNRVGMLIDLSHVTVRVMHQVLDMSKAPVIFSHSSAFAVGPHKRNVPDEVLKRVNETGGIVMVNFYDDEVTFSHTATLANVADHFDHLRKVAGAGIVGFGGDYDGVERLPEGLEDVSKVPHLVAELLRRRWSDLEVKAALGNNLLRALKRAEEVRDRRSHPSHADTSP
ncbi:LOW QUALITY PROTEIN: dipeptidase 1 [Phycodurus eques]|uniref:LOW QUALITY PROTEIN: dipeptidase 1 n=1 Tax=Phycodurus eques TaxID=693459 RepID=UPI002ACEA5E4|nr:LOW QUALITY PROTEIN: dipeptidase 1 [Phycodurus eques]